jgi:predicted CopG family antitoxin
MNNTNTVSERTTISLNRDTYIKLSHLGFAGESFDETLNKLIDWAIEARKQKNEEEED